MRHRYGHVPTDVIVLRAIFIARGAPLDDQVTAQDQWQITLKENDPFMARIVSFRRELRKPRHKVEETLHTIDALTGAYTSTLLLPHLREEQKELKAHRPPYNSLFLLRLDLTRVNREQGHDKGDAILRSCLTTIRQALSPEERVYRHPGAEFVIRLRLVHPFRPKPPRAISVTRSIRASCSARWWPHPTRIPTGRHGTRGMREHALSRAGYPGCHKPPLPGSSARSPPGSRPNVSATSTCQSPAV